MMADQKIPTIANIIEEQALVIDGTKSAIGDDCTTAQKQASAASFNRLCAAFDQIAKSSLDTADEETIDSFVLLIRLATFIGISAVGESDRK